MFRRVAVLCVVRFRGRSARQPFQVRGLRLSCGHVVNYEARAAYYRKTDHCERCVLELPGHVVDELREREKHKHWSGDCWGCSLCYRAEP